MKRFIIRNSEGDVLRVGQCSDEDFNLQVKEGEFISEGIVDIPEQVDSPLVILRGLRNSLLKECDWTQMPDAPLSDTKRQEWETYRQELRNLPNNYPNLTNMNEVVFPEEP